MASLRPFVFRVSTLAAGLAFAAGHGSTAAAADSNGTTELAPVAVEGEQGSGDYRVEQPSLTKLTAPLRDTPQTVDTVSRQQMDDQGVTNLRDALRSVPGISLAAGEFASQGDSLTIRGFTARNDIYLDGMRDFGSYYRDPFYLEGVQVLKGPSSILFGRGSTGGVVEMDSKKAGLAPLTAGTLSFGTDLTKRVTADVDRAVGPTAAIRVNVMAQDGGVAGRDDTRNSRIGIAPTLALGLGTPTRLTFGYVHQSEYDVPDYGLPFLYQAAPGSGSAIAHPAPVDRDNFYGFKHGDYLRTNVDIVTATVEHDVNAGVTLRDQFRYANYQRQFRITEPQIFAAAARGASGTSLLISPTADLSSVLVSRNQLYGTGVETFLQDQADATLRFVTGPIKHTLVTGFEVGRETSDPDRNATIGPYSTTPLLSPNPDQPYNASTYAASTTSTSADTLAAYAMDTLALAEQWQLTLGVRVDRFDADFAQTSFANPVTGAGAAQAAFHHVDVMASWRAALVYKPVTAGSLYVAAGTSFNPSAEALSLQASTAALAPEETQTVELGSKWDLLGQRLSLSGALFHSDKDNLRETDPTNSNFQILAGDAVAEGFETQATGRLTDRWQVQGGYAYTYSEVTKSPNTSATSDLGHRLANVPRHTASLWTTYRLPWNLQVGAGANYVSSRFASTTPTTVGGVNFWKEVPDYWVFSAMANYPLTEKVSLQVNLANLTDERYDDQIHPSHVVPGAGRSALFTVIYHD